MNAYAQLSPLRIANEAFLVAATIERCPKQMMLRELVMNALEAASKATDAPKQVRIDAVAVEGVPKLRVWNTGRGLSAAELLQISDLSSSLFKTVSLDGNFGMGAKAASLASNKHGLRYRSCRLGHVSQIVLGARDGVYGRLLQRDPADGGLSEAIDVTAECVAEGLPLAHDWTDVTLFGNAPGQMTAIDPYAGDPAVPHDWILQTLGRRFLRLPEGVELAIEQSASGLERELFAAPLARGGFDRTEAVAARDGIVIHYAYRAKDSALPPPRVAATGLGAVVYDGEVYALTEGRQWSLDAPTYGFTFAARQCCVIVELPSGFHARPEQYRQFLRFVEGDQRQVQFADFGALVRERIPMWLKRIIAAMTPAESDHLAEIQDEMRDLLVELGLEDLLRPPAPPPSPDVAPAEFSSEAPRVAAPLPAKRPRPPDPPEIIKIEDEAEIVEKSLGGRAARYYPATRQVFVNTRYVAFARLAAQLTEEFSARADEETVRRLAKSTAEWAIIQRIARTLIHSIGKPKSGWSPDEVSVAQSPETMSLMVDDVTPLLAPARRRMSLQLGLEEAPTAAGPAPGPEPVAQRAAAELADAEAQLQRAMSAEVGNLGQFHRQIAALHMQQRDLPAARESLERGMAADPADPWCKFDYAGVLLADKDYDRAAEFAAQALALAKDNPTLFRRRQAEVEWRRGRLDAASRLLSEAAALDPASPWPHQDLASLHLEQGRLDDAAAAIAAARERSPQDAKLLQRQADIELRRGNREASRAFSARALALDPHDSWSRITRAKAYAAEGRYDEALRELDAAFAAEPADSAPLHRAQSEIQLQRGERAAALAAAQRALRADPEDPWSHYHLSAVLQVVGDLDRAAQAAAEAVRLAAAPSAHFFRRQADIEGGRGKPADALALLERALALAPDDPWAWVSVSAQKLALNDLEGADEAARRAALKLTDAERPTALRRRAEIALRRADGEAARGFLREAMDLAPRNPWLRFDAANQAFAEGDFDGACQWGKQAIALQPTPHAGLLCRVAVFEQHRGDLDAARRLLAQAISAAPTDPQPWSMLSKVLASAGDLDAARAAAERAVEVASKNRAGAQQSPAA